MCSRYYIGKSDYFDRAEEKISLSRLTKRWDPLSVRTNGEIRPHDVVPVIGPDRFGYPYEFPMQWGFSGRKLLINARVESASYKPSFKEAWMRHRCIIPSSYYFEWTHYEEDGRMRTGDKYKIRPEDSDMAWICGLYRFEGSLPVFVILTREASDEIRFIHDRMPLMLPEDCIDLWVSPRENPESFLSYAVTDMEYEMVYKKIDYYEAC